MLRNALRNAGADAVFADFFATNAMPGRKLEFVPVDPANHGYALYKRLLIVRLALCHIILRMQVFKTEYRIVYWCGELCGRSGRDEFA